MNELNLVADNEIISFYEDKSPFKFLKDKYNGGEPTKRDIELIESLLVNQRLQPPVINVLIDYVLKNDNKQLNQNYVETIAGHWKRLNIETAQEALNLLREKQKKYNDKNEKIIEPAWLNKNIQKENMTKEEEKELENILNKYN